MDVFVITANTGDSYEPTIQVIYAGTSEEDAMEAGRDEHSEYEGTWMEVWRDGHFLEQHSYRKRDDEWVLLVDRATELENEIRGLESKLKEKKVLYDKLID